MTANKKHFKPITRIKKVIEFYYNRGVNSERVNKVYHKIIKFNYENRN